MAQSIQRGNEWWNQRPDGIWLKWSNDAQEWLPQPGGPPPPAGPDSPFSTAPAAGDFPADVRNQKTTGSAPASGTGDAGPPVAPAKTEATTTETESLPEISTAKKANSPIFSEARRELPSVRENKVLLGIVAGLLILAAFASTYFVANMFFSRSSTVANAQEAKPPKGFTKQKWTYILKKDRFCKDSDVMEFNAGLRERMASVESPEDLLATIDEAKAKFKEMLAGFQVGAMPKQDRPLLKRIFVLQNGVGPIFDRLSAAVKSQDLAAVQSITMETASKGWLGSEMMSRYGFQVCGKMTL